MLRILVVALLALALVATLYPLPKAATDGLLAIAIPVAVWATVNAYQTLAKSRAE